MNIVSPAPDPAGLSPRGWPWVRRAFVFFVVAFAWLRFSDNTADNDLWGHVLYGERMLALGHLETTDVLSWTAAGQPWMNHEVGAELGLALVHRAGGGTGLWLFMIAMGAITLAWACREGTVGRAPAVVTLALLAGSANFIATGYAVRPQLFTMLALVTLLAALRRFLDGRLAWGWALPPLFAAWVNFHGGFLAGWLVLVLGVAVETATRLWRPKMPSSSHRSPAGVVTPALLLVLGCTGALLLNPEGYHLLAWTAASVRLPRPHITEWQPMALTFGAAPFYFVVGASLLAWGFSRRARPLWQAAVLATLAGMAALQQRHAPLFGLANLMLTPEHLADALRRLAGPCAGLIGAFRARVVRFATGLLLVAGGAAAAVASVGPPRAHPFTIEVPHDIYPIAAIAFIRAHALAGNTLTFFDWGQQVLWELPDNPVSFDGRLDTVYPRAIMDAHWQFYAGESPGGSLDPMRAAVALLPTGSGAVGVLHHAGWRLVHRDPLASVLVRRPADFRHLDGQELVSVGLGSIRGRSRFPDTLPALATATRPR